MKAGQIIKTKSVDWVILDVDHTNKNNTWYKVESLYSGYITNKNASSLYAGSIKDPYFPEVFGVGFLGKYYFDCNVNKQKRHWYGMLSRCYSDYSIENFPCYNFSEVDKTWFNFENFVDWWDINSIDNKFKYVVDKDIKKFNNTKSYSPNNCILVGREINSLCKTEDYKGYERQGKIEVSLGRKYLGICATKEDAVFLHTKAKIIKLEQLLKRDSKFYNDVSTKAANNYIDNLKEGISW
jgi:hypothetical protein